MMTHELTTRQSGARLRLLLASSAMAAGFVFAGPAFAQDESGAATSQAGALERSDNEIVVTAQFRDQNLQDTPLAITALSGEALAERGVESTKDLVSVAPNVNITANNPIFGAAISVFVRGVGQYDNNFAYEPGVGIYLDDIYYGVITGADFALADIDRVEVLRGPQGTLSGKNSLGGSIKIYNKKPRGDGSGFVEATYGSYDRIDVRGAYDLGLIEDQLALRISGFSNHREGFLDRLDWACANPSEAGNIPRMGTGVDCVLGHEGGVKNWGVRAALRYTPTDDIEVNIIADRSVDKSEPAASSLFYAFQPPVGPAQLPSYYYDGDIATGVHYDRRFVPTDPYTNYATYQNTLTGTSLDPVSLNKGWGVSGDVTWNVADGISLRSITGYRELVTSAAADTDGSPIGVTTTLIQSTYEQFTQEVRLSGASDLLDWTVGGFYYDASGFQNSTVDSGAKFITNDPVETTSKSVFGHIVIRPIENFSITGGIRYTDDLKTYDFTHSRLDGTFPTNPDGSLNCSSAPGSGGNPLNCLPTQEFKSDRIDYRVGVDYRFSDELMAYANFSTGYRGGGVNAKPFTAFQAQSFGNESIDSWELGIRSDLFDRRLRLNLTGFYSKYKDIVLVDAAGVCGPDEIPFVNSICYQSAVPFNAGDADVKGLELETEIWPVEGLSITGSASYLDFQYTRLDPRAIASRISLDDYPPYTPKWKASGSIAYAFNADFGTITPRFDIDYSSKTYSDPANNGFQPPSPPFPIDPATTGAGVNVYLVPAHTVANARITYDSPDEMWQASLSVSNLFDKYYWTNTFAFYFSGFGTRILAPPRQWAVTVRRKF